jgi:hypothetical protein
MAELNNEELFGMRYEFYLTMIKIAEAKIKKHCLQMKIKLGSSTNISLEKDIFESIEKDLELIAKYNDQITYIRKYFIGEEIPKQ